MGIRIRSATQSWSGYGPKQQTVLLARRIAGSISLLEDRGKNRKAGRFPDECARQAFFEFWLLFAFRL